MANEVERSFSFISDKKKMMKQSRMKINSMPKNCLTSKVTKKAVMIN